METFGRLSREPRANRLKQIVELVLQAVVDAAPRSLARFNRNSIRHSLSLLLNHVRSALEMGFNEMPTDRFVESSFWNFDALF